MKALETGKHWLGIIFCVVKIRGTLKDTWKRESERVNLIEFKSYFKFVLLYLVMMILSSVYARSSAVIFYSNYNGLLFITLNLKTLMLVYYRKLYLVIVSLL